MAMVCLFSTRKYCRFLLTWVNAETLELKSTVPGSAMASSWIRTGMNLVKKAACSGLYFTFLNRAEQVIHGPKFSIHWGRALSMQLQLASAMVSSTVWSVLALATTFQ